MRFLKNTVTLSAVVGVLVSSTIAWAAAVSYSATVDKNKAGLGEPVLLTLTFTGVQSAGAPQIALHGFSVQYIGPYTQLSVINGSASSSVSHRFRLIPEKIGVFTIGPFTETVEGQTVTTSAITIDITKDRPVPASQEELAKLNDRAYVTIETDKKSVFINEKLSLRVKLFASHLPIRDVHFPVLDAQGFSVGAFGQPRQYQVAVNGISFNVLEFETHAFATRSGELSLGPAQIDCTLLVPRRQDNSLPQDMQGFFSSAIFNNFFGAQTQPLEIRSQPLSIKVLPLPENGKPADFTGAIGNFTFQADARPLKVAAGDPVTVTMRVRGQGNLATVGKPEFVTESGFKTYESDVQEDASGKIFEQVVAPQSASCREIPQLRFSFFDPSANAYKTLAQGPWPLDVTEAPARASSPTLVLKPGESITPEERIGTDIFYIKESGIWVAKDAAFLYQRPVFWIAAAFPLPLLWVFLLWAREKKKLDVDKRYARRLLAPRKAKNGLRLARGLLKSGKTLEFFTTLSKLIREYFGDRFHIPGASVTLDTVLAHIEPAHVPQDISDKIKHVFDVCDAARYALTTLTHDQMERALGECEIIIDFFQKEPRQKGAR